MSVESTEPFPVVTDDDDNGRSRVEPQPDSTWVVLGTLALGLPLAVAVVVLAGRPWFPVLDLAMTELRVRDVGGRHTPLIGLPGRIGDFPDQGSHPGPVSFYLWAIPYRAFGASAWALQVAAAIVNLAAVLVALIIGARRGGRTGAAVVAAVIAVAIRGFGVELFVEPWNPYAPLLWWLVVLLATWSVMCGDHRLLVVLVVAATICIQTHVSYLLLCVTMVAIATAAVGVNVRRASALARGPLITSLLASGVAAVALWVPPLVDQVRRSPGNLRMLIDHFTSPGEPPIGLRAGTELMLRHLDLVDGFSRMATEGGTFVTAGFDPERRVWVGALVLVVWLGTVALAVMRRHPVLLRLHAVVGVGLLVGVVSMSRIFGKVWFYLTLWAWMTAVVLLVAVMWTLVMVARDHLPRAGNRGLRIGFEALAVLLVSALIVASTVDASDAHPPEAHLSATLGAVLPATVRALDELDGPVAAGEDPGDETDEDPGDEAGEEAFGDAPGEGLVRTFLGQGDTDETPTGRDGRYVVTWSDAYYFGSQGYGLVNELEREGFDVGVLDSWRVPVTAQRVVDPGDATAGVHLATGIRVAEWRARDDAVEVVFFEPRSLAEQIEYDALRQLTIGELRRDGLGELVGLVDSNLFLVSNDPRVSRAASDAMARMLVLGQETAVFLVPPGAAP